MNKVKVNICGLNYSLITDNETDFVIEIAAKLDREIKALTKRFPTMDLRSAAIFCALEAYEERRKSEDSLDNLRSRLKEYMDESGKMRDIRDKAVLEANRLREKLDKLEIKEDEEPCGEDAEQLVLENTVTPAVTIPVAEEELRDAAPPRQNRAQRRSKKK